MTRISKSILLTGLSVLALAACSGDKGPGELGSKDDIVVRNNGLPGSQKASPPGGDFTSTVEQAEAIPAPEVAAGEPLPDNSPAMKEAVAEHQAANAPLVSTPPSTTDANVGSAAPSETRPLDAIAPTQPVTATPTPPPAAATTAPSAVQAAPAVIPPTPQSAPSVTGNVYPEAAAPVATPVPTPPMNAPAVAATTGPGPSAVPANVKYPLDPNAPYSPKAVADAAAAAGAAPVTPAVAAPATGMPSMTDPAIIKSAQAALKAKGAYTGAETGEIDANFLNALTIYQGKNGLAQGGLNEDTLRHLGLIR